LKLQSEIEAPTLCCPKNLSDLKCLLSRVRSDIPSQIPSLTPHITSTHLLPYEQKKLSTFRMANIGIDDRQEILFFETGITKVVYQITKSKMIRIMTA